MSGSVDFTLILLASQKAQNASEAALSTVTTLRSEHGGRLEAVEDRLSAIEGRLTAASAAQDSHARAILRIADVQAEHTASLARIEGRLDSIEATLAAILAKLP